MTSGKRTLVYGYYSVSAESINLVMSKCRCAVSSVQKESPDKNKKLVKLNEINRYI